jgi:hypothetical protein
MRPVSKWKAPASEDKGIREEDLQSEGLSKNIACHSDGRVASGRFHQSASSHGGICSAGLKGNLVSFPHKL